MSLKLSRTVVCAWLVAASMVPSVAAFSQAAPEPAAVNADAPPVTDTTTSPHRVIEKGGLKETDDVSEFEGLKERIGRCTSGMPHDAGRGQRDASCQTPTWEKKGEFHDHAL